MDEKIFNPLRERTDSKLRFAKVHLDELLPVGRGGSDFDRAHTESFLFHLLGAKDAFLRELNHRYDLRISEKNIKHWKFKKVLSQRAITCPEFKELDLLENERSSWLSQARVFRNRATHVDNIRHHFHVGGPHHRDVLFEHPETGEKMDQHFVDEFGVWLTNMQVLIERLRSNI